MLTSTEVTERAAYGRIKERRVRLASFCASTNNREFLTDITGNRRWLLSLGLLSEDGWFINVNQMRLKSLKPSGHLDNMTTNFKKSRPHTRKVL